MPSRAVRRSLSLLLLTVPLLAAGLHSAALADPAAAAPDEKLTAGSAWEGTIQGDPRRANSKAIPVAMKCVERDGQTFTVTFRITDKNGARTLRLKGELQSAKIVMQPTEIVKGKWAANVLKTVWSGEIQDDRIRLHIFADADADKNAQGKDVELTLSKSDGDGGKKHGK